MRDHDIPRNFHNPREVIEMGTVTLPSNWGEQCVNRRGPGKEAVTVITEGVKSRPRTLAFIHWMRKRLGGCFQRRPQVAWPPARGDRITEAG